MQGEFSLPEQFLQILLSFFLGGGAGELQSGDESFESHDLLSFGAGG